MGQTAHAEQAQQLPLQRTWTRRLAPRRDLQRAARRPVCAACREREARYGFQDHDDPTLERPRTLCFECFRMEIDRRQATAARLARGWNAEQARLPLDQTLHALDIRRRRAQIAARRAIGER